MNTNTSGKSPCRRHARLLPAGNADRGRAARDPGPASPRRWLRLPALFPLLLLAALALSAWTAAAEDPVPVPPRPSGLQVTVKAGTRQCVASWTALASATHYRLSWRLRGEAFLPANQSTVQQPGAPITLPTHGEWVVRLEGCNLAGCGLGVSQGVTTVPAKPSSLAVSPVAGGLELSASWGAAAGATSYKLRWRPGNGTFTAGNETVVTSTSARFTVPEAGEWVVRLEGCNTAGCGRGIARQITATAAQPVITIPGQAANLTVSFTPGELLLSASWEAAAGATSYKLRWRRIGGEFQAGNAVTAATTSAQFSVSASGRWLVRLEGCNTAGCGGAIVHTVEMVPGRPGNLTVTAQNDVRHFASWDAVAGATSYRLRWRRSNGAYLPTSEHIVVPYDGDPLDTYAYFNLLAPGEWLVRLEACDAVGCGPGATAMVHVAAQPMPEVPVCGRTPQVRDALVRATGKPCDKITAPNLAAVDPELDFFEKGLTSLKAGDFAGLSSLKILGLWYNNLRTLPAGVFKGLSDLRWLKLQGNQLGKLTVGVFEGMPNLVQLDLYGNHLNTVPAGVFKDLPGLVFLQLNGNSLHDLQVGAFDGLPNLQWLQFQHNALTQLTAGIFDGLSSLTHLRLHDNALSSLPAGIFKGLSSLEKLELFNNNLAALPEGVFDGLSALRYLRLGNQRWGMHLRADVFDGLSNLRFLGLDCGPLHSLPADVFVGLSRLERLELERNYLTTELPDDLFEPLTGLKELYLHSSRMTGLPDGAFDDLYRLKRLDLAHNDLTELPEGAFDDWSDLTHLYLYDNELTELPEGIFDDLSSLQELDLTDNPGVPFDVDVPAGAKFWQHSRPGIKSGSPDAPTPLWIYIKHCRH